MKNIVLKKLGIEYFREMKGVDVSFGKKLTVISGRNGTGKSSVLGLISQFLSFRNVHGQEDINYKTLFNEEFESEFRNHIKISDKFDTPDKKYRINIFLEEDDKVYVLAATRREDQIRFVLRGNQDRNFTWPSIYLDLRRLTPMVYRKEDEGHKLDISDSDEKLLIGWTNKVIPKIDRSNMISKNLPEKDINSVVATGPNYDIAAASSGEDNLGQILMSLLSFKRLKDKFNDYSGGVLLIDELDATLFPKSQLKLIDLLLSLAGKYNLQIIFTTHSPTILNYIYEKKEVTLKDSRTENDIAINYLTNTKNKIENMNFDNANDILDDLELKIASSTKDNLRKVNVYCEDTEASDMLKKILPNDVKSEINIQSVSLGAEQYISLIRGNVTEFKKNSIIILDADKKYNYRNVLTLPFGLPPDQLVYKYLYDMPAENKYWENKLKFNKTNFASNDKVNEIQHYLKFDMDTYIYQDDRRPKKIRTFFKEFYQDDEIKTLQRTANCNVFTRLKAERSEEATKFIEEFRTAIKDVKNNIYIN